MANIQDLAAEVFDTAGFAVITGGASGIGFSTAARLLRCGMAVALLDVSGDELEAAAASLQALQLPSLEHKPQIIPIRCDVASPSSCESARQAIAAAAPEKPISFLFCNAGIAGRGGQIMQGPADAWSPVFAVNVFGVVNTIKAFLPGMIAAGPLASGKKSVVMCTSSVVGLVHTNVGPYAVSKMACTALVEELALELQGMGAKAAHVSPHLLAPSPTTTSFFNIRDSDGTKTVGDGFKSKLAKSGAVSSEDIVEGFVQGLKADRFYIVVDHELDVPTSEQIALRMEDQMLGNRPRKPQQVFTFLKSAADIAERRALMVRSKPLVAPTVAKTVAKSRL